jgi:hypothetical protein
MAACARSQLPAWYPLLVARELQTSLPSVRGLTPPREQLSNSATTPQAAAATAWSAGLAVAPGAPRAQPAPFQTKHAHAPMPREQPLHLTLGLRCLQQAQVGAEGVSRR